MACDVPRKTAWGSIPLTLTNAIGHSQLKTQLDNLYAPCYTLATNQMR